MANCFRGLTTATRGCFRESRLPWVTTLWKNGFESLSRGLRRIAWSLLSSREVSQNRACFKSIKYPSSEKSVTPSGGIQSGFHYFHGEWHWEFVVLQVFSNNVRSKFAWLRFLHGEIASNQSRAADRVRGIELVRQEGMLWRYFPCREVHGADLMRFADTGMLSNDITEGNSPLRYAASTEG